MLSFVRKNRQSVLIGGCIEVIVEPLTFGKAKVHIKAPNAMKICRKELEGSDNPINVNCTLNELYELSQLLNDMQKLVAEHYKAREKLLE